MSALWQYDVSPCGTEAVIVEASGAVVLHLRVLDRSTAHSEFVKNLKDIVRLHNEERERGFNINYVQRDKQ